MLELAPTEMERMQKEPNDLVGGLVHAIRSRILAWAYPPDTRLLEIQLSSEFGSSRGPVREALRILEAGGFVEKQPNRGYKVCRFDITTANELYEVRTVLEMYVVERLACSAPSETDMARWRGMWSDTHLLEDATPDQLAARDREFHEALAEALGNATLLNQLRAINDRISVLRVVDFENESTVRKARELHERIVEAIAARNPVEAREAMRENIRHAQANVRRGLTEAIARAYLGNGRSAPLGETGN